MAAISTRKFVLTPIDTRKIVTKDKITKDRKLHEAIFSMKLSNSSYNTLEAKITSKIDSYTEEDEAHDIFSDNPKQLTKQRTDLEGLNSYIKATFNRETKELFLTKEQAQLIQKIIPDTFKMPGKKWNSFKKNFPIIHAFTPYKRMSSDKVTQLPFFKALASIGLLFSPFLLLLDLLGQLARKTSAVFDTKVKPTPVPIRSPSDLPPEELPQTRIISKFDSLVEQIREGKVDPSLRIQFTSAELQKTARLAYR